MVTRKYYKDPVGVGVEVVNNGIIEGRSTVKLQRGDRLLDEIETSPLAPNEVETVQVSADDLQEADIGDTIEYRVVTENASTVVSVEILDIPDSVVSRDADDTSSTVSISVGLVIRPSSGFNEIAQRISANTSGATRARLYDYADNSYVASKDISTLTAGDTFSFEYGYTAGNDYGIELDAEGSNFDAGLGGNQTYPVDGTEIDIIAQSNNGAQQDASYACINDIGNPDNVLG